MCSPMERDCRRRIELDLEAADVDAQAKSLKERSLAIHAERTQVSRRIIKAIQASGKPGAAVPVKACGREWTVGYSDWGGLSVAEVISPDSPLFRQPPVADAATAIDPDDDDAPSDPHAALQAEIARADRVAREAVIRNGKPAATPADIDPVAGLGGFLAARYGRPDPITQAAFDMAVDDELGPGGRDMLRALLDADDDFPHRSDAETYVPDDEPQAVS